MWVEGLGIVGALAILAMIGFALYPRRTSMSVPPLSVHLERAAAWLEASGYTIVRGRQEAEWVGYYDQDEFRKALSIDFMVRQGADYYAVKVTHTPDFEMSGLRLREEWFPICDAFGVKGILHLDVTEGTPHSIDFELKRPRYVHVRRLWARSAWMMAGAFLMFAWLHRN